jgi:hypothetical protein
MVTRPLFSEWNTSVLHPPGCYDVSDVLQNQALRKIVVPSSSSCSLKMKTESNTILRNVRIYLPKARSNRWKYLKSRRGFINSSVCYHLVVDLNIFGTKSQTEPAYEIKQKQNKRHFKSGSCKTENANTAATSACMTIKVTRSTNVLTNTHPEIYF